MDLSLKDFGRLMEVIVMPIRRRRVERALQRIGGISDRLGMHAAAQFLAKASRPDEKHFVELTQWIIQRVRIEVLY